MGTNVNISFIALLILLFQTSYGYAIKFTEVQSTSLETNFSVLLENLASRSQNNRCCANGQWEAISFLSYGAVLSIPETHSFFYYSGTGKIAFDDVRKKSFVSFNITAFSPQIPVYSSFTTTTIQDVNTGTAYQINDDGLCTKYSISRDLKIVCIPESSTKLEVGKVGSKIVTTYQFSTSDGVREQVTSASVLKNGTYCEPVMISRAEFVVKGHPQGTVFSIDILDLTRRIRDPTIFDLPKSCKSHQ